MMFRRSLLFLFGVLMTACRPANDARTILEKSVEAHGGDRYARSRIEFDFRKYHLVLENKDGRFRYERSYQDTTGAAVREVLTNDGLTRTLNGKQQTLDTAAYRRYTEGVNSVAYFVLLPYKLTDPAVVAEHAGERQIDGQTYHRIRVSFRPEGGGKDYKDVFFYWINQQTHTMDYLAYSEGGPRFRKAVNPQVVGGIRFQDYVNYKGENEDTTSVGEYDLRYQRGQLPILSRIEQRNIRVTVPGD